MASIYRDLRRYVRIADAVREQIAEGSLVPGQPVPTITELCLRYGHCRATISKGLRLLESEGLLCRVRGLGYYVPSESVSPLVVAPRGGLMSDELGGPAASGEKQASSGGVMWDQAGRLDAYLGDVPPEVRLLKLSEEVGEAAEAWIGMHGHNPRKGVCRTQDDVLAELADVIITAAVAMAGVAGNATEARQHFECRLGVVLARAGI
jgi:hypothetical protein